MHPFGKKTKTLWFIVFSLLLPQSPAFSLDVQFHSMRLFKAGYVAPRMRYRSYSTVFNRANTRYLHLEFAVNNLWRGGTHRFEATAYFYYPSGRLMRKVRQKFVMPRGSGRRYYTLRAGFSRPGIWLPGRYKVRLYIENRYASVRYFTVYRKRSSGGYGGGGSGGSGYGGGGSGGSGSHGTFPAPKVYGRTGTRYSVWQVKNDTRHTLYLSYKGPEGTRHFTIKPYRTRFIRMRGGYYKVFGSLSRSSVKPFKNRVYMKSGYKYRTRFYIKYRKRRSSTRYDI